MRLAQAVQGGARIELLDGVKIHHADGWVLVLPDGSEAYCHLWAEAKTELAAKKYLDEYSSKVQSWQQSEDSSAVKELKEPKSERNGTTTTKTRAGSSK
jgi:phosphomannomutase